jgi:hypothetical protein
VEIVTIGIVTHGQEQCLEVAPAYFTRWVRVPHLSWAIIGAGAADAGSCIRDARAPLEAGFSGKFRVIFAFPPKMPHFSGMCN